jgi:hypothetical protein
MSSKIKALGLALVAVFAMSALAASAAQAQNPAADVTCGEEGDGNPCTIKAEEHPGEGTQVFKTSVGNISCDEFDATGTAPHGEPASELTLTEVEYNSCNFGGLAAEVDFDDCHYTLHDGETTEEGVATSEVDVSETQGKECSITITAFTCTVTVGPQNNLSSITLKEVEAGGNEEITGEANVEGIAYSYSGFCGSGSKADGVYEGKFTARAFTGETQTDLTLFDTEA